MQAPAALFMLQLQQGLHAASRIMQSLGPFLHQGSLACVSAGARTQWLGHSTSTQGKQSDAGKKRAEQHQTSTSKASNFGSDRLSPHLPYVKQSKSQRCFTQSVRNALNQVLVMDPKLKEALIQPFGVAVTAVKLSRDRQEAIVLWDCWQGKEAECTQALRSQVCALSLYLPPGACRCCC